MTAQSNLICGRKPIKPSRAQPQSRTEVKTLIFMAIISGRGQVFVVPVRIFGLEPVYHSGLKSGQIMNKDDIQKRILRNILSRN